MLQLIAALRRVFQKGDDAPRMFRQQFYQKMAALESSAWELCGTKEQRDHSLQVGDQGIRPHHAISQAWDEALRRAYGGLEFDHVIGNKGGLPNGFSTERLVELQVCHSTVCCHYATTCGHQCEDCSIRCSCHCYHWCHCYLCCSSKAFTAVAIVAIGAMLPVLPMHNRDKRPSASPSAASCPLLPKPPPSPLPCRQGVPRW